jgi:hypothetical protein
MHKVGDLLKELGFNKDAPLETQKAFLRHLVAKAEAPRTPPPVVATSPAVQEPVQLSFDPKILGCG